MSELRIDSTPIGAKSAELIHFETLLQKIQDGCNAVIQGERGNVNPEAVIKNRKGFIAEIIALSALAKEAYDLLPETDGKGPLMANTSFGFVITAGDVQYADGNFLNVHDFSLEKIHTDEFDETLKEKWIKFLQEFFDSGRKIKDTFRKMDEANSGGLTKALNKKKER